jgi:serine/threonine protein kinase
MNDLELLETVGTGTFGRVRLARCISNNKYYALKMMKKSRIVKLKQLGHIQYEVKILSRLRCIFAVNFEGMFQDDANIYLVLEYVAGGELFSHLRRKKKFDEDTAKFYTCEVISALEYMHKIFIAHRDIRPENLLIGSDGHICIIDFGFAKIVPEQTYTLCGTPEYIAPVSLDESTHLFQT